MNKEYYCTTKDGKVIYYPETEEESIAFHNERLAEMPKDILEGSVNALKELFFADSKEAKETVEWIKKMYEKDPHNWIHIEHQHHMWGMAIRNYLREKGFKDDILPIPNWDDYYTQVIEVAVGLRSVD